MSLGRCTSQALEEVVASMCQDRKEEELLESYAGLDGVAVRCAMNSVHILSFPQTCMPS